MGIRPGQRGPGWGVLSATVLTARSRRKAADSGHQVMLRFKLGARPPSKVRVGRHLRSNYVRVTIFAVSPTHCPSSPTKTQRGPTPIVKNRSPDRPDGVLDDRAIGSQEGQPFHDGLTDEHSIEGITMQVGQARELKSGGLIQRERVDSVKPSLFQYESIRILRQGKSAECELDRYLPPRNGGEVNLVRGVFMKLAGTLRQSVGAQDDPKEGASIQQESQWASP